MCGQHSLDLVGYRGETKHEVGRGYIGGVCGEQEKNGVTRDRNLFHASMTFSKKIRGKFRKM